MWNDKVKTCAMLFALIGSALSITIDNKLGLVRNDCYERMAIGERLKKEDIYKTLTVKTVQECQMSCTQEQETCRAFSFGVGAKITTCELSSNEVKETKDLKPLGTIADSQFDLYIKKLGCKIVAPSNFNKKFNDTKPIDDFDSSYQSQFIGKPIRVQSSLIGVSTGPENSKPIPLTVTATRYDNKKPFFDKDRYRPYWNYYENDLRYGTHRYDRPYYDDDYYRYKYRPNRYPYYESNHFYQDEYRPDRYYRPNYDYYSHRPRPDYYESRPSYFYKPSYRPERPNHFYRPNYTPDGFYDDFERPGYFDNSYQSPKPAVVPNKPAKLNSTDTTLIKINMTKINQSEEVNGTKPLGISTTSYGFDIQRPMNIPDRPTSYGRPFRPYFYDRYDDPNYYPNDRMDGYSRNKPKSPWFFNEDSKSNRTIRFEDKTNFSDIEASPRQTDDNISIRNRKPIVTKTVDRRGQTITSIITEISKEACFRRVLAGKRVIHAFVRKTVSCERVEDCQRECSDEKHFVCEGFNYRLDPTGHGQGDCELLDLPLVRLDVIRDVYTHPEYDYYERDRNSNAPECKGPPRSSSYYHYRSNNNYDDRYDPDYDYSYHRAPLRPRYRDSYDDYDRSSRRRGKSYDHRNRQQSYDDYNYKHEFSGKDAYHYNYPPNVVENRNREVNNYEPYLPPKFWDRERPYYDHGRYWDRYYYDRQKDRNYWGFPMKDNGWGYYGGSYGNFGKPDSYYSKSYHHQPYDYNHHDGPIDLESKKWGQYGGTYGYGHHKNVHSDHRGSYDYWNFHHFNERYPNRPHDILPPYPTRPSINNEYLPPSTDLDYNNFHHEIADTSKYDSYHHRIVVPPFLNHIYFKDECSLRTCVGVRLHRSVVKKSLSVPHIYQCEILCYKEKGFVCVTYAFRYTTISNGENCFLSSVPFKELDYYIDLEPDRDFDIYSMNNLHKCNKLLHDSSECFWRVRSGQRLDHQIVRDSLNVKSIVQCQIECLKAIKFTCRAFSFRYGPPIIGGAIDNCQLTDWPYIELDPIVHLKPENGFELYDRGSYGHGCEPNHFTIGIRPGQSISDKRDQVCYITYGSPAKLLQQAIKKSLKVQDKEECKAECTRLREKTIFQCSSLSFRTSTIEGSTNCDLTDIVQRDLLSNVDYIADPNAILFAWDNHNPQCALYYKGGIPADNAASSKPWFSSNWESEGGFSTKWSDSSHHSSSRGWGEKDDNAMIPLQNPFYPLDTWKVYSVKGWPCKSLCKENEVAGFWYCYLEGSVPGSWDYCCRPDHQCGYSEGFPYQWCYVGPNRTQWRKCNEQYYPYHEGDDRNTYHSHYHLNNHKSTWDRTHHNYNSEYSDRPIPDGFGEPRYWPVAYLHKEMPPNETSSEPYMDGKKIDSMKDGRYSAIENLINVIKSNEVKDIQYQITNSSNKSDDILYVKIPLPANISKTDATFRRDSDDEDAHDLEAVDFIFSRTNLTDQNRQQPSAKSNIERIRNPAYRRSYIERSSRGIRKSRSLRKSA